MGYTMNDHITQTKQRVMIHIGMKHNDMFEKKNINIIAITSISYAWNEKNSKSVQSKREMFVFEMYDVQSEKVDNQRQFVL